MRLKQAFVPGIAPLQLTESVAACSEKRQDGLWCATCAVRNGRTVLGPNRVARVVVIAHCDC
jgi:hypothetical protein